jgi:hypothetical protein
MPTNLEKYRSELSKLVEKATILHYNMAYDLGLLKPEQKKDVDKSGSRITDFKKEYEEWYSTSIPVIRQLIPDRLPDFIALYKNSTRKEADYLSYTMSDYLIGLRVTQGGDVKVDPKAGFPKYELQRNILEAASKRVDSVLFDLKMIVKADLLDSEIEEANYLSRNGFLRAAGAVAGVVLESHLDQVCGNHGIAIQKKNPSISDYNDLLKEKETIDVPTWRFVQHLGDLRNLCDHKKKTEPTPENISDLIAGVTKITKTVF